MKRAEQSTPEILPDRSRLIVGSEVRALVRDFPTAAAILDVDGHAWIWNAAAELLFPPPPQTATATYPLFSLNGQPWFADARATALRGSSTSDLQWRLRGLGGTHYRVGVSISPLRQESGDVAGLLAVLQDSTQRHRSLQKKTRRARWSGAVLDHLPDAVLVHRGGRIVYANRPALRLFGAYSVRQLLGREIDQCVTVQPQGPGARTSAVTRARVQRLDGSSRTAEFQSEPFIFRSRRATNVTLRELPAPPEVRVQRSTARVRIETPSPGTQGVILLDAIGYVKTWDAGSEAVTGYRADEIVGRDLSLIYTDEGVAGDEPGRALRMAIAQSRYEEEGWKRRKDGTRFWCQVVINALFGRDRQIDGFAVILHDHTQHRTGEAPPRQTEDQLRHAQRMEAIGRLAGGIAHDFNNLLTAIQGNVQFLLDDLPDDHGSRRDAQEIKKAADRATSLTRQLLTFSRRQELDPQVVNLNEIIGEMGELLRRVISENIRLQTSLAADLGPVRSDPGQIEQVLMNLVVNARDALQGGGTITIRTANIELDDAYADRKLEVGPGQYVLLSVSDTGIGMDRETQSHIFEPFFTTKDKGKGTGLGLATVYSIVKQNGGHIWVYSEPGHGTTFKIYLPRVAASGEVLQRAPRNRDTARPGETILLVEDEPAVRGLARRVLESRGYTVLEAASGQDAIVLADNHKRAIHLLLSDVVVPDLNGSTIAERLHENRPDVRLLFMSGYTDQDVKLQGIVEGGAPFIEKPFTPDLLARRVREVLDE